MTTAFHAKLLDKMVDVGEPRFNVAHERLYNTIIDADLILAAPHLQDAFTQHDWDKLGAIFDDLSTYAKQHFAEEEAWMFARGYPNTEQHQAKHHALIHELNLFQKKVMAGDGAALKEVRRWLLEWLLNHVNHEDYAYAQFFGVKASS